MAQLYRDSDVPPTLYKDRRFKGTEEERVALLAKTTTLYVGNLSFYTLEDQIWDLFSKAGEVRRIIVGLDRVQKTPCGFCFVEYFTREDAQNAVWFCNGSKLDDRVIRVDWDLGFEPGREFGRGKTGGQVRDEHRTDYDPGRGGFGKYLYNDPNNPSDHNTQRGRKRSYGDAAGPPGMANPSDDQYGNRYRRSYGGAPTDSYQHNINNRRRNTWRSDREEAQDNPNQERHTKSRRFDRERSNEYY